jgi:beta-glucosidase
LLSANPVNFLGVNYYFPHRVLASDADPILHFECAVHKEREKTEMGWEIYPEGLHDLLMRLKQDYGNPRILITENGAAFADANVFNGQVQDDDRIGYIRDHLQQAQRAIASGAKLEGYFLWSLIDNFEWSFGFSRKFGVTKLDRHTLGRTWKKSASWYQRVIATNGAQL